MLIARLVPDQSRERVLYTDLSTRPYRQGPLQLPVAVAVPVPHRTQTLLVAPAAAEVRY